MARRIRPLAALILLLVIATGMCGFALSFYVKEQVVLIVPTDFQAVRVLNLVAITAATGLYLLARCSDSSSIRVTAVATLGLVVCGFIQLLYWFGLPVVMH